MDSKYEAYRNLTEGVALPRSNRIWQLTAAGLENLALAEVPLEPPTDEQVLVRCDAIGICASDVKMTWLRPPGLMSNWAAFASPTVSKTSAAAMSVIECVIYFIVKCSFGQVNPNDSLEHKSRETRCPLRRVEGHSAGPKQKKSLL